MLGGERSRPRPQRARRPSAAPRGPRRAARTVALQELQLLIDGKETVMGTRSESLDPEAQRRLGIDLFNRTWTLIERPARTPAEDDELLHCAHASAYHWAQVGTRGEPRPQRVAVLARLRGARPCRAGAPPRAPLPRARASPRRRSWRSSTSRSRTRRSPRVRRRGRRRRGAPARAASAAVEAIGDEDDRAPLEADLTAIRYVGIPTPSANVGRRRQLPAGLKAL